jgi:hypothetical protein
MLGLGKERVGTVCSTLADDHPSIRKKSQLYRAGPEAVADKRDANKLVERYAAHRRAPQHRRSEPGDEMGKEARPPPGLSRWCHD